MRRRLALGLVALALTLAFVACASFGEPNSSPATPDSGDATTGARPDAGCSTLFTEEFEPSWSPALWEEDNSTGATLDIAEGGLASPGALRAEVTFSGTSGDNAQLAHAEEGALPKSAMLSFATRVLSANTEYFEIGCTLQMQAGDTGSHLSFQLELSDNELKIDENAKLNGTGVDTDASVKIGTFDSARWYRLRLELHDISPAGARALGYLDDMLKYSGNVTFPAPPTRVRVKCGIDYADDGGAAVVLVDAVRFDVCR